MIQTITLIAALWIASGIAGVLIILVLDGGVAALTDTRDNPQDRLQWMLVSLGPVTLAIAACQLLTWAMPRLMRFLFKR